MPTYVIGSHGRLVKEGGDAFKALSAEKRKTAKRYYIPEGSDTWTRSWLTTEFRRSLPPECFADKDDRSYVVCGRDGGMSCNQLKNALTRAMMNNRPDVQKTAQKLLDKYCQTED